MQQFVYKKQIQDKTWSNEQNSIDNIEPVIFYDVFLAIKYLPSLIGRFGFSIELIKLLIKLIVKRNVLYSLMLNKKIISDGVVSFGHCNYYDVGKNDCIIGTVHSDPEYRGKGLATTAIESCIDSLRVSRNIENVYIDTSDNNVGMQKVIEKLGFGLPIYKYERNTD
jgi:GNAT superfamily N-acetyltransferase